MNTSQYAIQVDGALLAVTVWEPEQRSALRGAIQVLHGMAEHSGRYERLAQALVAEGYAVCAHDHRGHGKSVGSPEQWGLFAERDGWSKVVDDAHRLFGHMRERFPGVPHVVFGHSMGSFIARRCLQLYGAEYDGAILSGTGGDPGAGGWIGALIARLDMLLRGKRAISPLMSFLMFGGYNRRFRPVRTPFDWLSRDEAEVDKYICDDACGAVLTTVFYYDMITGVLQLHRRSQLARMPRELPVLLLSGSDDPVGGYGKGVSAVSESFRSIGMTDVSCKLYPGGRHEMLNEINRDEVQRDIVAWLAGRRR